MSGTRIPDGLAKSESSASSSRAGWNALAGSTFASKEVLGNQVNQPLLPNLPVSNLLPQDPFSAKAVQTPVEQSVFAREIFKQTAAVLGFPWDTLSVALLAFARFFSLSPEFLGTLRREILASGKPSSPGGAKEKAALEAKSLAAVIALDKGVVLSPEALESYANFLVFPDGGKENSPDREELQLEELQNIAEEQAKGDDLLNFLNFLPGKNGQHWTVFPLKIKVRGIELSVFIRTLNRDYSSVSSRLSPGESDYLIADIAGPKRQWRCFLKKKSGKFRVDIRVYPEYQPRALKHLSKEAERFFGTFDGFEEILVRNGEEVPSWVEDLCDERVTSRNEEV